ncbi:MAG: BlaI/MecI/CopY family transcriptional regulator [Lachnospiraceae bacterium]|nr:BlaI/MecI/CopY family transcriptional regulator [Lachnospiraceae bacterium]
MENEYAKLCDSDYRFMCIVWDSAPVNSGELVKLCQEKLGWKKSTTYTVIRKMQEKGYIDNQNAMVTVLTPKEQVQAEESTYFVDRTFGGSLPNFVAAFLGGKKISEEEARVLKRMIDAHREY